MMMDVEGWDPTSIAKSITSAPEVSTSFPLAYAAMIYCDCTLWKI